jgi:hypothetical protein
MITLLTDFGPYVFYVDWLAGEHFMLRDYGLCCNRCHDNAVKGFQTFGDNIYDYVCSLFQIFRPFFTGNFLGIRYVTV